MRFVYLIRGLVGGGIEEQKVHHVDRCRAMTDAPEFSLGAEFLKRAQDIADQTSRGTDKFCVEAGESLPQTMEALGSVLSILYRLASCHYGCRGGDHQVEWLAGKFVSQAISAHRLVRAAQYDEALLLVRGMMEITNLLWLFQGNRSELTSWKAADRRIRLVSSDLPLSDAALTVWGS